MSQRFPKSAAEWHAAYQAEADAHVQTKDILRVLAKQMDAQRHSLRDRLAGQALQGLLAGSAIGSHATFAKNAYEMADAMLDGREADHHGETE